MWWTAYRLRPPLARAGVSGRFADYLLIAWRGLASVLAVIAILWGIELGSGRGDLAAALREIGLHARLPAAQMAVLSLLLFAACFAINLGFMLLRQALRVRPKLATVKLTPQSPSEDLVFAVLVSPVAAVSEEIVFRGLFLTLFTTWTSDPVSAVASQAVLFGLIHLYQGGLGVLRTIAVGLVLGAGTFAAGSLIPAIAAHTLINIAVAVGPRIPVGAAQRR